MAIYAISDLHLSFQTEKPMNIFGNHWEEYEERIKDNWNALVNNDDIVLMPGDISWATYLNEAVEDFSFINKLNGIKIISKGNHDYWWETLAKLERFLSDNSFDTINFVHNTIYEYGDCVICAAKGFDNTCEEKIINRETERMRLSLELAKKKDKNVILMLHYPPFDKNGKFYEPVKEVIEYYKPSQCIYGHLHGKSRAYATEGNINGTEYRLVSCDCIEFKPIKI